MNTIFKKYKQYILFTILFFTYSSKYANISFPSYSHIYNIIKSKFHSLQTKEEINKIFCIKISGYMNEKNAENIVSDILYAKENPHVKGVIIIVNSGGGNFGEFIQRELTELQKTKPIITFITNYCCSAAYQAICGTNIILGLEESVIGGIGVVSTLTKHKTEKFNDSIYKGTAVTEILTSGKYKGIFFPNKQLTKEQKEYIINLSNSWYKDFVKNVAEKRNFDTKDIKTWADGKIFIGSNALTIGFIDKIGCYSDTLNEMKKLLNLDTKTQLKIIKGITFNFKDNLQILQKSHSPSKFYLEQPFLIK